MALSQNTPLLSVNGYVITGKSHQSGKTLYYQAIREADHHRVLIKKLNTDFPSPADIARFHYEYRMESDIQGNHILRPYALEKFNNAPAVIYEDFGGIPLRQFLDTHPSGLSVVLKIGIQLAEALDHIHQKNILHKGIHPLNILIDPQSLQVKMGGFSLSTSLESEQADVKATYDESAALPYISPEQTGRMNCAMDYRTDFYSLGVTLYEMLTCRLPFDADDRLKLIHHHLALMPQPPHEVAPAIPEAVSLIVMKLLAKKAEDRYQTAHGIKTDLENCLTQLDSTGKVTAFPPGEKDISSRFRVSRKLYGRERQINELLQAFERASRGPAGVMMVTGYSGIGKSSLVNEIHKPITKKRGYFISGKSDQYKRDVPYQSLAQAFRDLLRQLLAESNEGIEGWKRKLTDGLGPNGQIIIDVIPELESIIGSQQPVPELPPAETQSRFNIVFQNFVKVFADANHPLAVFLDDLQWTDLASLKLIELLATDSELQHLLLIGAYRDNEVDAAHPLMVTLEKIRKAKSFNTITLQPLGFDDVNQLLADSLNAAPDETEALAEISIQKTSGNPFFLNQFLKTLHHDGLLAFDYHQRRWQWEIEKIKKQNITENVVELMSKKIRQLNESTQDVLKLAACIGSRFDLKTLAVVCEQSPVETSEKLWPALSEGLVVPVDDAYKYIQSLQEDVFYEFLHDRVQQAAYSLIEDTRKNRVHLKIGRLLLENTAEEQIGDRVFDIVNQLNFAKEIIEYREEKERLAHLNLLAGRKALASIAHQPAYRYLKTGIGLLDDGWQRQYPLMLALNNEATEACYLLSDFKQMEHYAREVLRHAKTLLEKIRVYEIMISASISREKMHEAVQTALEALGLLGVRFPQKPGKVHILLSLLKTQALLAGKKPQQLLNLPEMTDQRQLAAIRLMARINSASYLAMPELLPLLVLQAVRISVRYGNTAESGYAYALYGMILCGVLGNIEKGYRFGTLAQDLIQKLNIKFFKTRIHLAVNDFVRHWKEPVRSTFEPMVEGYRSGLETGDLEFAGFIIHNYCSHLYWAGVELKKVDEEITKYSEVMRKLEHKAALLFNDLFQQAVLNFMGKNDDPRYLIGDVYDERKMLKTHLELKQVTAIYYMYVNKLMLCYHFEDYEQAIENAGKAMKYLEGAVALFAVPLLYLYDTLARLALYPDSSSAQKINILRIVNRALRKLKKWAKHAPANHLNKYYLLAAEKERVLNRQARAIEFYEKAIRLARENEFTNEEALANELAGKFHLSLNNERIAQAYLREAHFCYRKWGADAKVALLEKKFPYLIVSKKHDTSENVLETTDLETVFRASRALSDTIVLEELLKKIMQFLIQNAGAQKGVLLLEKQKEWFVEAEVFPEHQEIKVLQSLRLAESKSVAPGIINYVLRTRENVVLDDAAREGNFTNEQYVLRYQPKSVLCTPLIHQGKLMGLLYLENNLVTNAFTTERLELVNMLSSQMGVSIENARLYKAHERFVPRKVLSFLGKDSLIDIQLGNQVQKEMTVMFSDIRDFTALSEKMTPEETFRFINEYLALMEPLIIRNNGFIDKYMGDGIMALFPGSADDALCCAIGMVKQLSEVAKRRIAGQDTNIQIGIGLNTGSLMLGIIGGENQVDTTVLSDTVNLSSRLEGLTKTFGISLVISEHTYAALKNPAEYAIRCIGSVNVKGKTKPVRIYEVFDGDESHASELKKSTLQNFQEALRYFHENNHEKAFELWTRVLDINPQDVVAKRYLEKCQITRLTGKN